MRGREQVAGQDSCFATGSIDNLIDLIVHRVDLTLADHLARLRLDERLSDIQEKLCVLTERHTVKDYYSTEEVAKIVGKDPYTVREWCRAGRVKAVKRQCGRGKSAEWAVPHEELVRFQNEGLLPLRK